MILKVIHYCWFGHNKKSELIEKCIASWYKYCPDYKIIEWNEENYDVFKETIGKRVEPHIETEYVFQKNDNLPEEYKENFR